MSYFVSQITLEAALVFLLLGLGYRAVYSMLLLVCREATDPRATASFLKSAFYGRSLASIRGSILEPCHKKVNTPDSLHAVVIMVFGVLLTLSAYALCDGVPRLYALLFFVIGYFLLFILQREGLFRVLYKPMLAVLYLLARTFLLPFRTLYKIRHLLRKNDKT